ncbi:MAG: peptidoglycan-binding domain-containing protein [Casimicrobiaceae bacterium]
MNTGAQLLALAETRLGEKYVNVQVPKDNRNWHGPWDCAEFASWLVYQAVAKLYGCVDDAADPALADAYSGAWVRAAVDGKVNRITQREANSIPGAVLIRKPPAPGRMGHIAITDGRGGTVEAAGINLGVRRDRVEGRLWNYVATIPELKYSSTGYVVVPAALPYLLTLETPNIKSPLVRTVQRALRDKGVDPGKIDGEYGPHTLAAVEAFQAMNRLVADGICGPRTAKKLGIEWPAHA